ncbi:predicted protein [Sclerotinia sclerotiorum 1980 UF-70]|uniref:Uncharacterized protein n=1 Tax=Sclerotinia sclerotiorum (strain ATCC 18683 / 1980 / Ss-1) TaxID=665079 RepID=A7EQ68_SCLS1|nr:predicted protein [Sclerotinia sclerotiorum 1980 UF-70]EDO04984.1 predicted protein [Sclerotinia sclerotiorum 1980 UF-70]
MYIPLFLSPYWAQRPRSSSRKILSETNILALARFFSAGIKFPRILAGICQTINLAFLKAIQLEIGGILARALQGAVNVVTWWIRLRALNSGMKNALTILEKVEAQAERKDFASGARMRKLGIQIRASEIEKKAFSEKIQVLGSKEERLGGQIGRIRDSTSPSIRAVSSFEASRTAFVEALMQVVAEG